MVGVLAHLSWQGERHEPESDGRDPDHTLLGPNLRPLQSAVPGGKAAVATHKVRQIIQREPI